MLGKGPRLSKDFAFTNLMISLIYGPRMILFFLHVKGQLPSLKYIQQERIPCLGY